MIAIQPKSRQILGVNQQAYQALKSSLSLNLRRQLLIAVCDSVTLQEQLATQLETDLERTQWSATHFDASAQGHSAIALERLQFDPEDGHLPRQVAHWVRQATLTSGHIPQLQMLGVERMTHQPALSQSQFLRSLEKIEALLPRLNTSLLIWLSWPWLRTIQSSSPTFWKWRSGVFEFVSDPTPTSTVWDEDLDADIFDDPTELGDVDPAMASSWEQSIQPQVAQEDFVGDYIDSPLPTTVGLYGEAGEGDRPIVPVREMLAAPPVESETSKVLSSEPAVSEAAPVEIESIRFEPIEVAPVEPNAFETAQAEPEQVDSEQTATDLTTTELGQLEEENGPRLYTLAEVADLPREDESFMEDDGATGMLSAVTLAFEKSLAESEAVDLAIAQSDNQSEDQSDGQSDNQPNAPNKVASASALETAAATNGHVVTDDRPNQEATRIRLMAVVKPATAQPSDPSVASADSDADTPKADSVVPETTDAEAVNSEGTDLKAPEIETVEIATVEIATVDSAPVVVEPINTDDIAAIQTEAIETETSATVSEVEGLAVEETAEVAENPAQPQKERFEEAMRLNARQKAADDYFAVGYGYRKRIEAGERGLDLIEPAIAAYEGGLRCLSGPHPDWGSGLNDLGTLYWLKAQQLSDPQEELDCMNHSIELYQEALDKVDLQQEPEMVLQLYSNMGAVYSILATYGEPTVHFHKAVSVYCKALQKCSFDTDPVEYATLNNSLGSVYWKLSHYEQVVQNLRHAISAYNQALVGYAPDSMPLDYAAVQNNLGITYWSLAKHQPSVESLKNAIAAYRDALNYRTPETAPAACATTYNNLALAYWDLSKDRNIEPAPKLRYQKNAITAFEAALRTAEGHKVLSQMDSAAIYHCLGDVHAQMIGSLSSQHDIAASLQKSLYSYVRAIADLEEDSPAYQARLNAIVANLRSQKEQLGLASQQAALNRIPPQLISKIMVSL
ncbi:MAG: tetratricopeptide repeat protein [Cyanobacteria bacterium J06606_4]